jgi:CheY-like chemotaxis protein
MNAPSGTVLVVEDDYDIRDALKDILDAEGFPCAFACDGLEALDYLRASPPPSLILLDWMMPNCDAPGFRREQLADPKLASIPVVLLTAGSAWEQQSALNVERVLRKPIKLSELIEVVAAYCSS